MKYFALAALLAVAQAGTPPTVGLGHGYIPANREDYDNAKELWKGDFAKCRGARLCERGGWCSGYDGCEGTPLPDQAPGLLPDSAREEDGAPDMTDVRELHSQIKLRI